MIKSWETKLLFWMEKVELVKSVLLAQFLFLFQSLPLELSPQTHCYWQVLLCSFDWLPKKPLANPYSLEDRDSRICFHIMQLHNSAHYICIWNFLNHVAGSILNNNPLTLEPFRRLSGILLLRGLSWSPPIPTCHFLWSFGTPISMS